MALDLALCIQDFINTNRILGRHIEWDELANRRFTDSAKPHVFEYQSKAVPQIAVGQTVVLMGSEWFRLNMTFPSIPDNIEHRFDMLRIQMKDTHTTLEIEEIKDNGVNVVLVKLITRHPGRINLVFVVREGKGPVSPFLAV
jgi:hypothetical protein